jgi:uncharacterized protein (TIGR00661 family)
MRILYGLSGDGLGHVMRARVVAAHLAGKGHVLRMATWGRAAALLRQHGFDVVDVRGLTGHYEGGRLRRGKTLLHAIRETPRRLGYNARVFLARAASFAPDVVLTDFNGFACAVGHALKIPTVSLDHQHVIDRFRHPWRLVGDFAADFAVASAVVSAKTPLCHRYVVTSFFFPDPRHSLSTAIAGPVMRPEVERLSPSHGEHVVVYQTARGDPGLVAALRAVDEVPFHVYGHGVPGRTRNVELRHFDEAGFSSDLASARAVIANGGFTAISEALYLGKPVLSIPLAGQAEQQLNAAWLAELRLGMRSERVDGGKIRRFLDMLPELQGPGDARLRTGTRDTLAAVDRVLAEVA